MVQIGSIAMFTLFAGLHCAMIINNKNIIIKFSTNVFLSFLSAVVAGNFTLIGNKHKEDIHYKVLLTYHFSAIATLAAVLISIPQFMLRRQQYHTEPGACYYIEIALIFVNIGLTVVSYISYNKARKTNFPKQRNPYEINSQSYG